MTILRLSPHTPPEGHRTAIRTSAASTLASPGHATGAPGQVHLLPSHQWHPPRLFQNGVEYAIAAAGDSPLDRMVAAAAEQLQSCPGRPGRHPAVTLYEAARAAALGRLGTEQQALLHAIGTRDQALLADEGHHLLLPVLESTPNGSADETTADALLLRYFRAAPRYAQLLHDGLATAVGPGLPVLSQLRQDVYRGISEGLHPGVVMPEEALIAAAIHIATMRGS